MMIITIEKYTWEGRTSKRSKGFGSRELLNKIRSKAPANTPSASYMNPTNQKISSGTWKWPQTCSWLFLQQFSKMFLSTAASFNCDEEISCCRKVFPFLPKKTGRKKKDAVWAEIFSRSSYQPQKAKKVFTPLSRGTAQREDEAIGYQNHLLSTRPKVHLLELCIWYKTKAAAHAITF